MNNETFVKDKELFIQYAQEHTIPEIAEYFNLSNSYVKNYVGNHKIEHKNLDMWHGKSSSRIYKIYRGMLARCYNKKHIHYDLYGGRGIKVCAEWLNDRKIFFEWADKNGYEDNLQIDRIDCNGNYEPKNCRFVSNIENQNNRRCTRLYKGVPIGLIVANEECNPLGFDWCLIYKRLTGDNGRVNKWEITKALSTETNKVKGSHKVLSCNENIRNDVKKALTKYFPQVLE